MPDQQITAGLGDRSTSVVPLSGSNVSTVRLDTDNGNRDHNGNFTGQNRDFDRDDHTDHDGDMAQNRTFDQDNRNTDHDMQDRDVSSTQKNSTDRLVDRDINQQQQIESGLKSGQLSDAEAARLERGESSIDRQESRDLQNGSLLGNERASLDASFNTEENRINALEHNGVTGSPNSPSSRALQADVQRDINQEQRIDNGIDKGRLSATDVSALEAGQARDDAREAKAASNNVISLGEQQRIQASENSQSTAITAANINSNNVTLSGNTATNVIPPSSTNVNAGSSTNVAVEAMGNSTGFSNAGANSNASAIGSGANTAANTAANSTTLASVNSGIGMGNVTGTGMANTAATTTQPTVAPIRTTPSLAVHAAGGRH